jgi:Ca2+-binding RTX toxin-like protein
MFSRNGSASDEILVGVRGVENSIAGNGGDDAILGRGKDDLLLGGAGHDVVFGFKGSDDLFGGAGDDLLGGGLGDDRLSGDKGDNVLFGGWGDDTFVINGRIAGDEQLQRIADFDVDAEFCGLPFDDNIEIKNVSGQVFVFQETAEGSVEILMDGHRVAIVEPSHWANQDDGDAFSASAVLARTEFEGGSPKRVELLDETGAPIDFVISGTDQDDVLVAQKGIATTIIAGRGDDILNGRGKSDILRGNQGDDELNGGNGNDQLLGGHGDDTLDGGNGADKLEGGRGTDIVTGGNGADRFIFKAHHADTGLNTVTDFDASEGDVVDLRKAGTITYETNLDGDLVLLSDGAQVVVFEGLTSETELAFL